MKINVIKTSRVDIQDNEFAIKKRNSGVVLHKNRKSGYTGRRNNNKSAYLCTQLYVGRGRDS